MTKGCKRLLVIFFTALAVVGCGNLDPFDDQPFDPAVWATAGDYERAPMAREAIRQLPPGTTAARVRELIGEGYPVHVVDDMPPGKLVDMFGNPLKHPETWVYDLGCWSGLGPYNFDSAFLYVHFGPDGLVAEAEVTGG